MIGYSAFDLAGALVGARRLPTIGMLTETDALLDSHLQLSHGFLSLIRGRRGFVA
jgi:hypothetical protein